MSGKAIAVAFMLALASAPAFAAGPSPESVRALIDSERYGQAVEELKRLDAADPSSPAVPLLMGRIQLAVGKPAKALESFERASFASLDAEAEAYLGMAEARLAMGDLAKARTDAGKALRSDPDLVAAHLTLARADMRLGRSAEAAERIRKLKADRPDSEEAAVISARFAAMDGGADEAASELEEFVARSPTSAYAHDQLGQFLWSAGRKEEAVEARETAGRLYAAKGQTGRADAMAAWVKAVDPKGDLRKAVRETEAEEPEAAPEPEPKPVPERMATAPEARRPEPPPPQAHPRPKVESKPLARMDVPVAVLSRPEPLPFPPGSPVMTGSGVLLEGGRLILTNRHVVDGMKSVAVRSGTGHVRMAKVVKVSPEDDLALLETDNPFPDRSAMPLSEIVEPAPGRSAVVMGYPLISVLGDEQPSLTEGVVAKDAGLAGDPTTFQITAKVNKGNSGGPIFDRRGRLIGVAVGKLDVADVERKSGVRAEDVNFGVKGGRILRFLGRPAGREAPPAPEMGLEDLYRTMLPRAVLVAAQR